MNTLINTVKPGYTDTQGTGSWVSLYPKCRYIPGVGITGFDFILNKYDLPLPSWPSSPDVAAESKSSLIAVNAGPGIVSCS